MGSQVRRARSLPPFGANARPARPGTVASVPARHSRIPSDRRSRPSSSWSAPIKRHTIGKFGILTLAEARPGAIHFVHPGSSRPHRDGRCGMWMRSRSRDDHHRPLVNCPDRSENFGWVQGCTPFQRRRAMKDPTIGWIAAIIIGGVAGWLAEQFMKSDMGLLMNIVLGIVGAAIASAIFSFFGIALGRMARLPDCWIHRRVFADLGRPRVSGPHGVITRNGHDWTAARPAGRRCRRGAMGALLHHRRRHAVDLAAHTGLRLSDLVAVVGVACAGGRRRHHPAHRHGATKLGWSTH